MISIRKARLADATAIGAVHVAAWRTAYAGLLPDTYLSRMSVSRHAAHYESALRAGTGVVVASASGADVPAGTAPRIVGFSSASRARTQELGGRILGEGEIETLYVLDDWRDRGVGRRLLRASAAFLADSGCRSAYLWVLRENPSRWFYQRLGGVPAAEAEISFAGQRVMQTAFSWDPIERLLASVPGAS